MQGLRSALISAALAATSVTEAAAQGLQQVRGVPANPSTPASVWSEGHGAYCQQSILGPGLTERDAVAVDVQRLSSVDSTGWLPTGTVLGRPLPGGRYEFWGANGSDVYRVEALRNRLVVTPVEGSATRSPSGYWLMDNEGTAYVPDLRTRQIVRFRSATPFNPSTPIVEVGRRALPAELFSGDEFIRGMKMLHSGEIVVTTSGNVVAVLDRSLNVRSVHRLDEAETDNNPCVDEHDNVYVTSGSALYKLHWNGTTLSRRWRVAINGSGSTPTLIGTDSDPDRLVAITDRSSPMRLVVVWRDDVVPSDWPGLPGQDRRIAGDMAIDFGVPGQVATPTENSILAAGYDMLLAGWTGLMPRLERTKNRGAMQVRWDAAQNRLQVRWRNTEVEAPNSMQAMSVAANRAYVVSLRGEGREATYGLEILNWSTGESMSFTPLGSYNDMTFNVYGSGLQIGPNREILIPAPRAIIRFRPID